MYFLTYLLTSGQVNTCSLGGAGWVVISVTAHIVTAQLSVTTASTVLSVLLYSAHVLGNKTRGICRLNTEEMSLFIDAALTVTPYALVLKG